MIPKRAAPPFSFLLRERREHWIRRWKRSVGLLALAVLLVGGGCVVGFVALELYLDPFDDRPFDPAVWAANGHTNLRGPMARDAIRHLPTGTHKDRVRELLGEPKPVWRDPRGPVDGYGNRLDHPETWAYPLGSWSGFGPYAFDDAYLYVHFGSDGCVVAAEVTGG